MGRVLVEKAMCEGDVGGSIATGRVAREFCVKMLQLAIFKIILTC